MMIVPPLTPKHGESVELRHLDDLDDLDDITGDFRVGPDGRTRLSRVYVTPFLDDNLSMAEYGDLDRQYFYFLRDGLGSVSAVTDAAGRVRSRYDYTAFGEDYVPDEAEEVLQRFGYTGRERSGASSLLSYRFRQYNPALGRFSQRDPAGTAGGINLYGYVENQPYRFVDPYGLWLTDTHVAIQIQAIREEFGLECDPENGACPSVSALFKSAHAEIDNPVFFFFNSSAHALTRFKNKRPSDFNIPMSPEHAAKMEAWLEEKRLRDLKAGWQKSIDKFNKDFLYNLNQYRLPHYGMREMRGGGGSGQELIRDRYRKMALWELSFGQHAVADPAIHDFQTWIGDHYQFEPNWGEYNPMVDAEERIDKYVKLNKKLPLDRDNESENINLAKEFSQPLKRDKVGELWDDRYGGYDAMAEKYSNENLQQMLNKSIDDSRKHLRELNSKTNGDIRNLLIESGCKEDDSVRRE